MKFTKIFYAYNIINNKLLRVINLLYIQPISVLKTLPNFNGIHNEH